MLDKRKTSQPTPVEVLRLNHDSPFMVMDTDDAGYVAEEGTVVQLANRHSLIVMEGRNEKAPWKGRKPVTLEVQREYASNPALPMTDSLRDLFHLGFVNWRGFGTKTKPATLAYANFCWIEWPTSLLSPQRSQRNCGPTGLSDEPVVPVMPKPDAKRNIVFLLGAGASKDAGLPLAIEITDRIVDDIERILHVADAPAPVRPRRDMLWPWVLEQEA